MPAAPYAPRLAIAAILTLLATASLTAQQRTLRVITPDSVPIPYAWVAIQGQTPRIADEKGMVTLGSLAAKSYAADIRRIGYTAFAGPLNIGETTTTISLAPLATPLGKVTVTGQALASVEGFYRRWLKRQNGGGPGSFIGPEEIEKKNTADVAGLIRDQSGLKLERARDGGYVAIGTGSNGCQMAVMVDGQVVRAAQESSQGTSSRTGIGSPTADITYGMSAKQKDSVARAVANNGMSGVERKFADYTSANSTKIDQIVPIDAVVAVEVYARTGNLPAELNLTDNSCGLIAIWTGARK